MPKRNTAIDTLTPRVSETKEFTASGRGARRLSRLFVRAQSTYRRDAVLPVGIDVDEADDGGGGGEHGRDEVDGYPDAAAEHDALAPGAALAGALGRPARQPRDRREHRQAQDPRAEAAVHRHVPDDR